MGSFEYIRGYYHVPAKRGAKVEYNGKVGTVTGTSGPHVRVRLEGQKHSGIYHPTDLKWIETPMNQDPECPDSRVRALVSDAAEAEEHFSLDELEAYAEELRRRARRSEDEAALTTLAVSRTIRP